MNNSDTVEVSFASISAVVVNRAVNGEASALRTIVDVLQRPFFGLALRMLGNYADAEEATQEALIRVTTRLSTFKHKAKFSTWAWRVAVNRILDFREGRARQPRLSFDAFAADLEDGLDSRAPMPDDRLLVQQLKVGCGRALLQCLDGDHRAAYVLGDILGFQGPDASSILDVEPSTFRKRLSRAREKFRAHLQSQCGVVHEDAACRCHRRAERALALSRLEPRDRDGSVDVEEVTRLTRALPVLEQSAAFYRADPSPVFRAELVAVVHHAIGI